MRSPLLDRKSQCCFNLRKRYKHAFVSSKKLIFYLIWIGMVFTIKLSLPYSLIYPKGGGLLDYAYICSQLVYLLFPLFGYIGEKWTRYYLIITGVIVICVPAMLIEMMALTYGPEYFETHRELTLILITCVLVMFLFAQGMLGPNLVQFGADQIQSAPSQELASYARWCVFVIFLADSFLDVLQSIQHAIPKFTAFFYILAVSFIILTMGSAIIGFYFKYYLTIEPPSNIDPVKLIGKVIKYAWKHKYPERPSSFTYSGGIPSRLDYGKNRYGGPFTTDQVEDVKSFWNVLVVILSSAIVSNFNIAPPVSLYIWEADASLSIRERVLVYSNSHLLVIIILFFQFVIVPFFPSWIPSMLKRIWIGLALKFISFLTMTITSFLVSQRQLEVLLIFAGIINNTGTAVVTFSSLELIFAQAPCYMQGILVGFSNIRFATEDLLFWLWKPSLQVYSSIVTGLILVSLILYSIAVYFYKYRVRNELSDVNFRIAIEEVFERDFERERNKRNIGNNVMTAMHQK